MKQIKIFLFLILGLVIFFIWARYVDFPKLFLEIKKVKFSYVFLSFISFTLIFFLKSKRIQYFFNLFIKVGFFEIAKIYFITSFVNYFVAFSSGVPLQLILYKRDLKIPLSCSLPALFVARYLDVVVMVFLIFLLPFSSFRYKTYLPILLFFTFIFFIFSTFILIFPEKKEIILKFLKIITKILPSKIKDKILNFTTNIFTNILFIKKNKNIFLPVIIITLVGNILEVAAVYFLILGFSIKVSFITILASQGLFALLSFFPTIPAQIGITEASISIILSMGFGLENNKIAAASVVGHSLTIISLTFLFLFSLPFWGGNIPEIFALKKEN